VCAAWPSLTLRPRCWVVQSVPAGAVSYLHRPDGWAHTEWVADGDPQAGAQGSASAGRSGLAAAWAAQTPSAPARPTGPAASTAAGRLGPARKCPAATAPTSSASGWVRAAATYVRAAHARPAARRCKVWQGTVCHEQQWHSRRHDTVFGWSVSGHAQHMCGHAFSTWQSMRMKAYLRLRG